MTIVANVKCKCGAWVRIRTLPDPYNPRREYGWVLHTQAIGGRPGCQRKLEIERNGGRGARIVGRCDGSPAPVNVDYQD